MALFRQIAIEPLPTGSRFIDKDQVRGFCLQLADEVIHVGIPGADGAEVDDVGVVVFGNICDSNRLVMDIQSDIERARVRKSLCLGREKSILLG
jgi:hypothetical protein